LTVVVFCLRHFRADFVPQSAHQKHPSNEKDCNHGKLLLQSPCRMDHPDSGMVAQWKDGGPIDVRVLWQMSL
jgi:hypothetical protein